MKTLNFSPSIIPPPYKETNCGGMADTIPTAVRSSLFPAATCDEAGTAIPQPLAAEWSSDTTPPVRSPPFLLCELPIDLLALAVTHCVQTYHDDPRAVAVMLNDLRWYPPDRWPWLTNYFKTRLPKTETTTQQTPEVTS